MSKKTNYHMSPAEFRRYGKEVIDWIADYYEWVESKPVVADVEPGEVRAMLPDFPPQTGESFPEMMDDVDRILMPGITHWQSPNFFAYFPSNTSFPSILGEIVAAGLGVQGMVWKTSPAATELETHVLDWMAKLLGLPEHFLSSTEGGGVIQDTASSAVLCAMLAAREQATAGVSNREGVSPNLVAYTSDQAHSSVQKAARIAGIGDNHIRMIETDEHFAMNVDALDSAMAQDRASGLKPFFVSATMGTTSSMAMDPIEKIANLCAGVWLHVDGAMAGTAAVCDEYRWINKGLERAQSYCFNPHKWMFTNFDCNCFYVSDRQALIGALSILPEYLRTSEHESGAAIDYRDWQIPLGRRFRSLKLWFVLRHYGGDGLRHHISEHVKLAEKFEQWVLDYDDFELVVPRTLNTVCFRHRKGNEFTEKLMARVNATGKMFVSHTKLGSSYTIRMVVGSRDTELRHISAAWNLLTKMAGEIE